jgi:SAM-dependent MidA family methyltransferase
MHSATVELLKKRITREGLLTYEAFVGTALYDERLGYYRTGKADRKDYYTSPEIHATFGRTVGRYIETVCARLKTPTFTIVELGGASGRFAGDVLSALSAQPPERYFVVEKGLEREEGRVRWVNDVGRIEPLGGVTFVLANEFFDALPFHRVINRNSALEEIYVGYDDGFFEQTGPLSPGLAPFLDRYPVLLPPGQATEVTTYGLSLLERLSTLVSQACFIVFDYGYHGVEIEKGRFPDGSILGYSTRRIRTDVFDDPGNIDITHHVNLDHLAFMLEDQGWRKEGETEQYRFLINAGIMEEFSRLPLSERLTAKWLINPEGLGSTISVLGFTKGLSIPLPGFGKGRERPSPFQRSGRPVT